MGKEWRQTASGKFSGLPEQKKDAVSKYLVVFSRSSRDFPLCFSGGFGGDSTDRDNPFALPPRSAKISPA
jgi:hypothetical protein